MASPNNNKGNLLRIAILAAGALLFGLLFFADKTNLNNPDRELKTSNRGVVSSQGSSGSEIGFEFNTSTLPPLGKDEQLDSWIAEVESTEGAEKIVLLDSVVTRLENRQRYGYAAQYASQMASQTSSLQDLLRAGRLHQQAARLDYIARDTSLADQYNQKAIAMFKQVTEQDSTQEDALYFLGVALVENGKLPMDKMQGVLKVRKVLSLNPDHIQANYTLGVFSVQTQQFDKAEGRFEKVLSLQPDNQIARYYLAQVRINQNKLSGTRELLEEVIKKSSDPELKRTARNLINDTF